MTCPRCGGAGRSAAVHLNRGSRPPLWLEGVPCRFCRGTGRIGDAQRRAYEEGERMRAERIARGESLREAARRLGITLKELSARERGDRL